MSTPASAPVSFDRVAQRYDETRGGAKRAAETLADIRPWLAPGTVLEIGVGTGLVAGALLGAGIGTVGVDISPLMAAQARERIGPRVVLGDARHLPVRPSSVDNALFVWSLHVVGDPAAALAEAARVVRPGGRVVASHGRPDTGRADVTELLGGLEFLRHGERARPDTDEALAAAGGAAGLAIVHNGWTAGYPIARTPNQVAEQLEAKVWSYLWRLDEAEWAEHVAPVIATLRALPDPDRPREYQQRHRISVFAGRG